MMTVNISKRKYRTRLGIMYDMINILGANGVPIIISALSRRCNLSHEGSVSILKSFLDNGLITKITEKQNNNISYMLTDSGYKFRKDFIGFVKCLEESGLNSYL